MHLKLLGLIIWKQKKKNKKKKTRKKKTKTKKQNKHIYKWIIMTIFSNWIKIHQVLVSMKI